MPMDTVPSTSPSSSSFPRNEQPLQLSLPLPNSVTTTIHIHLTILKYGVQLFLTTRNTIPDTIPPPQSSLLDTDALQHDGVAAPVIDPTDALNDSGTGAGGSGGGGSKGAAPLGSFVVGFPGGKSTSQTLSTSVYICESTIDTTVRLAKILAKKFNLPVYVGNSMSFAGTGLGGSPEEEVAAFAEVVKTVVEIVEKVRKGGGGEVGEEVV